MIRSLRLLGPALAALVLVAGCGEKSEPEPVPPVAPETTGEADREGNGEREPRERDESAGGEPHGEDPAARAAERRRAVQRVVRSYLEGLDARDGAAVCRTLAPGALDGVRLPRRRGSCAASLDASIGYRDPRGLPQFQGVRLTSIRAADATARRARVTAGLITDFADREEPSIEDDIVYLSRRRGGWEIAKASAALFRAVGIADIPPGVIAPPQG